MEYLTPEKIKILLDEFVQRLNELEITGNIFIIGGAAMSLAYLPDRRETVDIDALFPSDPRIDEIIKEINIREDISEKWINNDAKLFIPFDHFGQWTLLFERGGISVSVAKPEMLLAMKLSADRGSRDRPDIEVLLNLCEVKTLEDAVEIFEKFRHQEVLKPKTEQFVRDWLAEQNQF